MRSNLKVGAKKRRQASTDSTSSSNDSTSTLAEHLTNAAMARQVSKISIAVEGMQDKIDELMKISKATPPLSEENVNLMFENFTPISNQFGSSKNGQLLTTGETEQNLKFVSEKLESLLCNQSKNQISQTSIIDMEM